MKGVNNEITQRLVRLRVDRGDRVVLIGRSNCIKMSLLRARQYVCERLENRLLEGHFVQPLQTTAEVVSGASIEHD